MSAFLEIEQKTMANHHHNSVDQEKRDQPGDLPIILDVLGELWDPDEAAVQRALMELANLCTHGDHRRQNRKEITRIGGPLTVVKTMQRHPRSSSIQATGCRALANFAIYNEACTLIATVGGIDCVLEAMQRFPSNGDIQESGCGAMYNFTCRCHENRRLIVIANGIPAILSAMQKQPGRARLQDWACGALESLSQVNQKTKEKIIKLGGVVLIAKAAQEHMNDCHTKEAACEAMAALLPPRNDPSVQHR